MNAEKYVDIINQGQKQLASLRYAFECTQMVSSWIPAYGQKDVLIDRWL